MPRQTGKTGLLGGLFPGVSWARFTFWLVAGVLLMVGTLFAWHRTEDVLIKDDRFRVAEADDLAGPSPNLVVEGIHYASASQIRHIFAQDFGRSLYLVPIQMRRQQLLEIDWVADATISKVWPDTLRVRIHERVPAAFVRLPPNRKDGLSSFALIDQDGVILRPRVAAQFTLPVITGVREDEVLHDRRARVHRALGMLKDVGPLAGQISEVDVTDPNNLLIAEHVGASVVNLIIGDENYAERLQNFVASYSQIKEKRPDATTLDLRVDGAITAVGDKVGEKSREKHFER
jgi:cell division protein FtsQ